MLIGSGNNHEFLTPTDVLGRRDKEEHDEQEVAQRRAQSSHPHSAIFRPLQRQIYDAQGWCMNSSPIALSVCCTWCVLWTPQHEREDGKLPVSGAIFLTAVRKARSLSSYEEKYNIRVSPTSRSLLP